MPSSRIVAVFGATGLQGSAVVDRLLQDGTFTPRAISRDPGSEASLRLKERGVEVFKANSSDRASLVNALRGSEAVFAVTVPSFGPPSSEGSPSEITQGKNIVDAAKEADVKFFVFRFV
ncbi:nucleotide-diphosphate-sugar epimerase/NmrA family protein [Mycena sanguinolenta]|nr:nucleotide-diphosphate-sugar epimerase/NmrA family protein [Mycena sanguinolenta]